MEHLYTSRKMSRVFRGLVLALAVVLVACGTDSDESEPTATTVAGQGQEALPTVPPVESTPDTEVNEEEITVLEPQAPATADAATQEAEADADEAGLSQDGSEASSQSSPDTEGTDSSTGTAESGGEDTTSGVDADATVVSSDDATEVPDGEIDATPEVAIEATPAVSTIDADDVTSEPTERARTGNETFIHPGDGTGGSGMPGELDSPGETEDAPDATPVASPIAQLEISGCEVPDVPGFLGDSNVFVLTADVNFRSGPGVDCDPVLEEPVGEGQIVLVLGGPVTQTEDDSEWVQIEIGGEPGWITTDFLEPSE